MNNEELAKVKAALANGVDLAAAHAEQTHSAYAGYHPKRHEAVDRDVADMREALAIIERATPAAASAGAARTIENLIAAIRDGVPLKEPVSVEKAMLAHRPAVVVLDKGTGPVAAVHLVNISVAGWVHNPETAKAYADGFNRGTEWLRAAIISYAERAATAPVSAAPAVPTESMLNAARDWSVKKYGIGIGNDAAIGCWGAMYAAALPQSAGAPVSAAEPRLPLLMRDDVTTAAMLVKEWDEAPQDADEWGNRASEHLQRMAQALMKAAAPADGQELPALQWAPPKPPTQGICAYDHVTAGTPFGRILITWKSWKQDPAYTVDEHPVEAFRNQETYDNLKQAVVAAEKAIADAASSLLAMRQPDPAGEWVKRADLAMRQQGEEAQAAKRYRWIRENVVSMKFTPADVDAKLREHEWAEWERSADLHISLAAKQAGK